MYKNGGTEGHERNISYKRNILLNQEFRVWISGIHVRIERYKVDATKTSTATSYADDGERLIAYKRDPFRRSFIPIFFFFLSSCQLILPWGPAPSFALFCRRIGMGRPPHGGGPVFRFTQNEVRTLSAISATSLFLLFLILNPWSLALILSSSSPSDFFLSLFLVVHFQGFVIVPSAQN